ncbi:MAG: RsmB/NOP family class I SAM-dependent RNA methyltransferase [Candidatus Bathyarchaeia archaeon]|jgi:16S rRNA (cytosine967-C5)-methyltransferase
MLREAWKLAIETLQQIEQKRFSERQALTKATKQLRIKDPTAIGLAHRLVTETLRKKNLIDYIINMVLAPKTVYDVKPVARSFLRLYTYETKILDSNLEKAARTAKMGRTILGWHQLTGIEEALGKILSADPATAMNGLEETQKVALRTFNPAWFVRYCIKMLGRDEAIKFLEKSAEPTPTYLRINTLKTSEEEALKKLEEENIVVEKVAKLKHTYKLLHTKKPLPKTQTHQDGLFYIQDKASCLAALVADPKPDTTVLDVCAAPGSKTTFLAQQMQNRGTIISVDYSKRRITTWKKETTRMGATNAQPIVADTRSGLPVNLQADLVILDPPCTSTGTFGKTPAAKWRLTGRSIRAMAKMQTEMLQTCAEHVKAGGFLVYATCSITLQENEMIITEFLKHNPEFKLVNTEPELGSPGLRGLTKCQRLYPHKDGCNGFFVAKLEKEAV